MPDTLYLWLGGKKYAVVADETLSDSQIKMTPKEIERMIEFEKNRRK